MWLLYTPLPQPYYVTQSVSDSFVISVCSLASLGYFDITNSQYQLHYRHPTLQVGTAGESYCSCLLWLVICQRDEKELSSCSLSHSASPSTSLSLAHDLSCFQLFFVLFCLRSSYSSNQIVFVTCSVYHRCILYSEILTYEPFFN
jgi:hypothetical protein